jgi:integrase/recombinase XerC
MGCTVQLTCAKALELLKIQVNSTITAAMRITKVINSALPARSGSTRLMALFVEGRSPATIRAYRADVADFSRFLVAAPARALDTLLSGGAGHANEVVLRYRGHLQQRGLKAATVNRRIATLRSVVAFARTLGYIDWQIAVRGVKSQPYRDTRGPGIDGVRRVLTALSKREDEKSVRDTALVRLMFDCALRCGEVVSLDVAHVELPEKRLQVRRKGRSEREAVTLAEPTMRALRAWLSIRGDEAGPLFTNSDRAKKGNRLTTNGVYRIMRRLGEDIGRRVRPHGLRHAAVTRALELTSGDVRSVAKFSSHRSIQTVLLYDDARTDVAGEVSRLVAESV